jgi:hypothetical protein
MITYPLEHAGFTRLSARPWNTGITTMQSRLFCALSLFAHYFNSAVDTVPNLPRKIAALLPEFPTATDSLVSQFTGRVVIDDKRGRKPVI